jgi:NAD(P)-dependent dehydrogenase (short-subunit alcohol dehydrogenase family)
LMRISTRNHISGSMAAIDTNCFCRASFDDNVWLSEIDEHPEEPVSEHGQQGISSDGREVALVTGANKGIGFDVARQLGEAGLRVWLGSRNRERGEKALGQLRAEGLDVQLAILDVTDDTSLAAAAELVDREAGRLDVLVNNAGVVFGRAAPSQARVDDVRRTYETNVFGVIATTNAFLPLLRRSPHGRVVNVSSELGSITGMADPEWEWAFLHLLAYQSSKAAQNAVTLLYAKELRTEGVPLLGRPAPLQRLVRCRR